MPGPERNPPPTPTPAPTPEHAPPGRPTTLEIGAVASLVVVGVVLRFVTSSPLWLDEALSVNIAALPVGDIADALRQDGHPPLYYVLLHGWMAVFGQGDVAVRALSGLFGVLALPLAYVAGRRRAGAAGGVAVLAMTAVTPWCVRYSTEARMYSLLFTLALGGWLLADDLLVRPTRSGWGRVRVPALAAVTGAALLTHYWALYLGLAAMVLVGVAWFRPSPGVDRPTARAGSIRITVALAAGAVAFLPWLGVFADQAESTGTPWGTATRPTRALIELAGGIGGGERYAEALLFGAVVYVLAAIGLTATGRRGRGLVLDPATVPGVRGEVAIVALTAGIGLAVGFVADAVFVARYAGAFLPMLLVAAGVGLARVPIRAPRAAAGLVVVALAAVGLYVNIVDDRTQGAEIAGAIGAAAGPDDVVAFCPDQLGPSTLRRLPASIDAVGLPALLRPDRIDWRDYGERNRSADPAAGVAAVLRAAGDTGTVWLVVTPGYRTYENYCEAVVAGLVTARPPGVTVVDTRAGAVFEPATLLRFDPIP